ncbi:enoyl-CoA hydratase [Iamia majanohamensis]|uniref:Enoyl-CoA hydratase n=1 Tax=Iamia majanohamensis TaxID=467976 RepID=A0AAE9YIQ0_9ACTN|nr:enoyl-CoA hydratase [Iamia majanohamensis]WCO68711.1 enoyl-CoA hydratase [Iamia majanohamensis]
MSDDVLLVEVADRVATVTMNRPEARNALSMDLLRALPRTVGELDADYDVAAIVLTGSDPAFCAGLDLREVGSGDGGPLRASGASGGTDADAAARRGPMPAGRTTPLIGAVNGAAVTGGLEVALACDWLVASERARFADTHARVGIQPGWGLSVLLPEAVGLRRARQMSATGNFVDAPTALTWGLVNQVVPHAELVPTAQQLARDVASNDGAAVARLFRTYAENAEGTGAEGWANEARVAAEWQGRAFDPDEVARRREAIQERGRAQQG